MSSRFCKTMAVTSCTPARHCKEEVFHAINNAANILCLCAALVKENYFTPENLNKVVGPCEAIIDIL